MRVGFSTKTKIHERNDGIETYLDDLIAVRCHVGMWVGCFSWVHLLNSCCNGSSSQLIPATWIKFER